MKQDYRVCRRRAEGKNNAFYGAGLLEYAATCSENQEKENQQQEHYLTYLTLPQDLRDPLLHAHGVVRLKEQNKKHHVKCALKAVPHRNYIACHADKLFHMP